MIRNSKTVARCLGAAAILLVGAASAQEPPRGATRVSPGGTTRVYVMAGFDAQCKPTPAATITIDVAPTKGTVSLREGQSIIVQQSVSGSCVGQRVTGTGIYYTAKPDGQGPDSFSITARLASGETASRTFQLNVSE